VRGGNLMAQPFDPGTLTLEGDALLLGPQVGVPMALLTWLNRQDKSLGMSGGGCSSTSISVGTIGIWPFRR
jgi:hypothetical protein